MSRTLYQIAMVGAVIIYTMTHLPIWGGHTAKPGEGGFEFTVAKQKESDESKQAQWLVKMSAGTFTMNFSWNP
jgi:hypothetical protein